MKTSGVGADDGGRSDGQMDGRGADRTYKEGDEKQVKAQAKEIEKAVEETLARRG
jgi:hypothetical protein